MSHSDGVATYGGILDHGSVGRRDGMKSEGFVVESMEEWAGVRRWFTSSSVVMEFPVGNAGAISARNLATASLCI